MDRENRTGRGYPNNGRRAAAAAKMAACCLKQGIEVTVPDAIGDHQGFCDRIAEEVG